MNHRATRKVSKPFTASMIILVLVIITLCAVIGSTWASYPASHTLTYTTNRLQWDAGTNIQSDGSAQLDVFSAGYSNVNTDNGEKLVAPGTSDTNAIVLRNATSRQISYTAYAYYVKNDARIPVTVVFDGKNLKDTYSYQLPAGIDQSDVLRVVTGEVAGNSEQDFYFTWNWDFETENLATDPSDTQLGDDAAAGSDEHVKVGFYIVVEDQGETVRALSPKTGDTAEVWLYTILAAVSAIVIILLLFGNRRRRSADSDTKESE